MAHLTSLRRILLSTAAAATMLSASVQPGQVAEEDLKVGVMLPMTGAAALAGAEAIIGFKLAVEEVNAGGGILGRKIVLIQGDDQSNPTIAVTETRRLIEQEGVHAMVGPQSSQNALAMAPVLEENKRLAFSVAGSAALTPEKAPYIFSSLFSSDGQAQAMYDYAVKELGARKIAIIGDSGAQARAGVKVLHALADKDGVAVTGDEVFDPKVPDATAQLLALRRGAPDVLLFYATIPDDAATILKNLKEIGWDVKVSAANVVASSAPHVTKVAGPDAYKNVFATQVGVLTYCPGEAVGTGKYADFLAKLKAFAPSEFDKVSPRNVIYFYSDIYIMKAGMEGAKSTDPDQVKTWLESNPVDLPTGTGRASTTSHFMISAEDLKVVINPDKPREDGLLQRAKCG